MIPVISIGQGSKKGELSKVSVREKRELKYEEQAVHKLCKKFAALCDDLKTTYTLSIFSTQDEAQTMSTNSEKSMDDIAVYPN